MTLVCATLPLGILWTMPLHRASDRLLVSHTTCRPHRKFVLSSPCFSRHVLFLISCYQVCLYHHHSMVLLRYVRRDLTFVHSSFGRVSMLHVLSTEWTHLCSRSCQHTFVSSICNSSFVSCASWFLNKQISPNSTSSLS